MAPPKPLAEESDIDEVTPLLGAGAVDSVAQANGNSSLLEGNGKATGEPVADEDDEDRPLPKTQIFLLCYARLVEPIAYFSIFPFVNKMIYDNGNIEVSHVGFYSGLIESLFSLTQMMVMILWGLAADRLGRKPVLVFSLCGVSIATALFGLSKTIWQMILFRCLAGVFAGTIVTIRVMITENSTQKTQARAFSFFAFTGNFGIFLGSLIGGTFSNPAENYPSIFGGIKFFEEYPYALPTFVTGAIGVSAIFTSAFFIKETLNRKTLQDPLVNPPTSTWELIKSPGVAMVVYIYGHVMLLGLAYTAVSPLFWFTDVKSGGFGLTPLQIGLFLCGVGASQAIWMLVCFPPLQHRFGTGGILRATSIAWPIGFVICPLLNTILRNEWRLAFWILGPIIICLISGVCMSFTAVQLALNDIAPTHATLGTLNAIALTSVSGIRAVAPALFSSIFAAGAENQILNGYLIWLVLIVLALALNVSIRWLPEKAEGKLKPDSESR